MTDLDKSMNRFIPTFVYEVYPMGDDYFGYCINWKEPQMAARDYPIVYKFLGRTANYWIVSNDTALLRSDALSFSIGVHTKKFVTHNCDLSSVSR